MFSLIPWRRNKEKQRQEQPVHPLVEFRNELDAMLERWNRWLTPFDTAWDWKQAWGFGLQERENDYLLEAELPGFDPDEIDVELSERLLTVRAEKKEEGKDGSSYRSYYRSITLPEAVDADKINARYHNGVLTIELPKRDSGKEKRRIAIKT